MSQTIGPVTTQKGPVCFAGGVGPVYGPGTQSFVLDQLSSYPTVAFSVRQLTANPLYVRPYCMLVRRSSDNATLNIGYVNGLLDIVSLLAFCGSGNGYVVTWYNQGYLGSSADATQSTAASQPQIVASGVVETQNGVPTVYFGGSQSLTFSGYAVSANNTAYAVAYQYTSGGAVSHGIFGGGVGSIELQTASGQVSLNKTNLSQVITLSGVTNRLNVYAVSGSNAGTKIIVSGISATNSTAISPSASTNNIGLGNTADAEYQIGGISEVALGNFAASLSDTTTYDLNAAAFYGITGVTQ